MPKNKSVEQYEQCLQQTTKTDAVRVAHRFLQVLKRLGRNDVISNILSRVGRIKIARTRIFGPSVDAEIVSFNEYIDNLISNIPRVIELSGHDAHAVKVSFYALAKNASGSKATIPMALQAVFCKYIIDSKAYSAAAIDKDPGLSFIRKNANKQKSAKDKYGKILNEEVPALMAVSHAPALIRSDEEQEPFHEITEEVKLALRWRKLHAAELAEVRKYKDYPGLGEYSKRISQIELYGYRYFCFSDRHSNSWVFPKLSEKTGGEKKQTTLLLGKGSTADIKTQKSGFYVKKFFNDPVDSAGLRKSFVLMERLFSYALARQREDRYNGFLDRICPVIMLDTDKGFMPYHKHSSIAALLEKLKDGQELSVYSKKINNDVLAKAYDTVLEDFKILLTIGLKRVPDGMTDAQKPERAMMGGYGWNELHNQNLLFDIENGHFVIIDLDDYPLESVANRKLPYTCKVNEDDYKVITAKIDGMLSSLCRALGRNFNQVIHGTD
ncbi:hypothetical protein F6R98_00450 [Candidatus Methylospira mobilis]|uniref:Uncharacterized protein n=1 Tax=Candidatus Methylospira mobilis TaxID=1808979 RepID=A0A5Q0BGD0_9GAMM|nr:hypothetical protein [Candidatus Methylospira mobilis]QFY41271.1 hypothetical protein F6R98_00450 [Candidatus Methylospira mobilis]WNV05507.1 hypothetical protein RP726_03595 [Candidatus Methylospira mobilis]